MTDFPCVLHHGGVKDVTGSCHELLCALGESVLIDCGLFQGDNVPAPQISA